MSQADTTTVAGLYRRLFAGEKISLRVIDRNQYESLRTALQRHHRTPQYLDMTTDSLKAKFDESRMLATFWLGQKRAATAFEIVSTTENSNAEIRDDLGEAQGS